MLGPTFYIVLDWIFTLLVLYSAFVAIGVPIAMSHVIAGFAIGMFFSIASSSRVGSASWRARWRRCSSPSAYSSSRRWSRS
jgi:hypothetical protein